LADGTTPLQLSILNPVQVFPSTWDVNGLRLGAIYSQNRHVYGLDIGFYNCADAASGGIQLGAVNNGDAPLSPDFTGLQLGILNGARELDGIQVGVGNAAMSLYGIQLGLVNDCLRGGTGWMLAGLGNYKTGDFTGAQVSLINWSSDHMRGVQLGLLNVATLPYYQHRVIERDWSHEEMRGVQIGIINIAHQLYGVQIGVLNIITESPVPFMPLLNAHF
jgi:hypothetical protein